MGCSATAVTRTQVAARWTRTSTSQPPTCGRWHFLCQSNGLSMAYDATGLGEGHDDLRLFSSLASAGCVVRPHGHSWHLGTPRSGAKRRPFSSLCGSSEYQDDDPEPGCGL